MERKEDKREEGGKKGGGDQFKRKIEANFR